MLRKKFGRTIRWTLLLFFFQIGLLQGGLRKDVKTLEKMLKDSLNVLYPTTINDMLVDESYDKKPKNWDIYDFIVVGAGSAGAAVAARLSEDPRVQVLLIEAGGPEPHFADTPLLALYLQLMNSINWNYTMERSPNYCRGFQDQRCRMPRGKVMGGCSVFNFMIATRASHENYDNWAKMGCDGWSWKDVYPIFRAMENFKVKDKRVKKKHHNKGGPMNIEYPPYRTKTARVFLEAAEERGFPIVDYDGDEMIGYAYTRATIKNGSRFSTNQAYIYPASGRLNLMITKHSHVQKILIEPTTKRAMGVLIKKDNKEINLVATREVILSAGAINTPQLLMLSGIGPAAHLEDMGISSLKDLPVGKNLQDHIAYWGLSFLVNYSVTTVATEVFSRKLSNNDFPTTAIGGVEAVGFLKVDQLHSRKGSPDMELLMIGGSVGSDPLARQAMGLASDHYEKYFRPMNNKESFMIMPILLQPKSRGEVLLKSKNPDDHPRIIPNYFDHPDDMRKMILGIREALKLIRTKALQKFDAKLPEYSVPGCQNFQWDSDDYWDCAVRTYADTLYHPVGTCKMGSVGDRTAVVDSTLKVIGIKGLRVADASVMPTIVTGHPNIPTIMIGEKVAKMIKQQWNMKSELI